MLCLKNHYRSDLCQKFFKRNHSRQLLPQLFYQLSSNYLAISSRDVLQNWMVNKWG
ncbi:hypothetical protein CANARDRAFT_28769 [[Candida] arabinofermentans NRRL YB-2248]|uniref:Uncharacterized protein n=1 Tax=[Candida] arabinofermentans NRRL YB-2248 TaxID=983967 RepID=A0A1E4SZX4_9ASCO|nr:hypothetical protein CANARDRAFT_28769 [[Candida] arabinofermentans NRRL YB-2248]